MVIAATALLSLLLCGVYVRLALRWRVLDTPGERSSHRLPTPHGGGAALVVALLVGLVAAGYLQGHWQAPYLLLATGALLLMLLGIADDLRGLSPRLRLALYALLCAAAAILLAWPATVGSMHIVALALYALALLWCVNLYNFMDGIDGLAALQAICACVAAAWLASAGTGVGATQYSLFCLLVAASHAGFLCWNWPPAKLFMGDAGSVSTGFLCAGLALFGAHQELLSAWCWPILLAVFITDASVTLLYRLRDGEPITQPHRQHAYQRLSRHWDSHRRVDLVFLAIFLLWLAPLAWLAQTGRAQGFILVILAYLPLIWGIAKVRRMA